MTVATVTETLVRVNYSETDQMGVAYHARYLVWLDIARTEHLRQCGASYRELETAGLRLVVSEVAIRYRLPARFDDVVRVRCWVKEIASRRVTFGYAVERAGCWPPRPSPWSRSTPRWRSPGCRTGYAPCFMPCPTRPARVTTETQRMPSE